MADDPSGGPASRLGTPRKASKTWTGSPNYTEQEMDALMNAARDMFSLGSSKLAIVVVKFNA